MTTATTYAEFAEFEARGVSPVYERLGLAVSQDDEVLALLDTLPLAKRQPQLLFGVVRYLGGDVEDPAAFHDYAVAHWPTIQAEVNARATQTNEAGRCAVLLPVLAALPQPLALLEVGASAGLCLYPDRYSYRYGEHVLGSGEPILECALTGIEPPSRLPQVVWRAGIELNPLDVTNPADVAWLDALIWPEQAHRRARLRAAAAVAAADPALLVRGDLADELLALAAQAPSDATLVVFHTSVLYQVTAAKQEQFAALVRELPGYWLSNDTSDFVPADLLPEPPNGSAYNLLALDGVPLAWTRFARAGYDLVRRAAATGAGRMRLPADSHVHSEWSWDAMMGSMEATCARAVELGLPAIAFTEHLDHTVWTVALEELEAGSFLATLAAPDGTLTPPKFDAPGYLEAIERCRERFAGLRILSGLEMGEPHWHAAAVAQVLSAGRFDRVLGSLHCLPDRGGFAEPPGLYGHREAAQVVRLYLAEVANLVAESDLFEVLAHIDYPVRYWPAHAGPFDPNAFEDEFRHALRLLADSGRALEVNTAVPLHPEVVRWWSEEGGSALTFGSDTHSPARLARGFGEAADMVQAHGFRPGRHPYDFWTRGPVAV